MFLGTTPAAARSRKGRLFLPAKYREELAGGVVITRGQERCLFVWPRVEFARITEKPPQLAGDRQGGQGLQPGAVLQRVRRAPDRQGRITVPAALRAYAGLQRDCVVIGANTRLEIWDSRGLGDLPGHAGRSSFADASEEVFPGIL